MGWRWEEEWQWGEWGGGGWRNGSWENGVEVGGRVAVGRMGWRWVEERQWGEWDGGVSMEVQFRNMIQKQKPRQNTRVYPRRKIGLPHTVKRKTLNSLLPEPSSVHCGR